MQYITVLQPPKFHQMSLEEFLFQIDVQPTVITNNEANTRTYMVEDIPRKYAERYSLYSLYSDLRAFNDTYRPLLQRERVSMYSTFYTEKRGKGMNTVFKTLFSQQGRFIRCSASDVCSKIAGTLTPLLKQHRESEHEAMMESAQNSIREALSAVGFNKEKIDLRAAISAGYRKIDAPDEDLAKALRELKNIFEDQFHALYHTSAFAYVRHRSTLDAVKRHQQNESKWFGKYDLSNFFGSTTPEFVEKMLSMVFPFSMVFSNQIAAKELRDALSLAFLNGGLPQGTPVSPMITNIMMIPIDYKLCNMLRNYDKQRYIYTRYADDFLISSRIDFDPKKIGDLVAKTLAEFGAPFKLNEEKTRYGSSAGSNWNLGVMLNKDNKITVGHEKKRQFRAMLTSYVLDKRNGSPWSKNDVQILEGYRNYYRMVEKDVIDSIVSKIGDKFGVDIPKLIKADLKV